VASRFDCYSNPVMEKAIAMELKNLCVWTISDSLVYWDQLLNVID